MTEESGNENERLTNLLFFSRMKSCVAHHRQPLSFPVIRAPTLYSLSLIFVIFKLADNESRNALLRTCKYTKKLCHNYFCCHHHCSYYYHHCCCCYMWLFSCSVYKKGRRTYGSCFFLLSINNVRNIFLKICSI